MWPQVITPSAFIPLIFNLLIFFQFSCFCFCSAMDRFLVCPQILSVTPQSLPVSESDTSSPITVKIKLPEFKYFTRYEFEEEKNPNSAIRGIQNYSCNFEVKGKSVKEVKVKQRKYVLNKIVNNVITVVCNSPVKSSLPKYSWDKHHSLTSDLTVHLRGYDFKACDDENVIMKTDFNFFDCSTYTSCESCAVSEFPCGWSWNLCHSGSSTSTSNECQGESGRCMETVGAGTGTGAGSEGGKLLITSSSNCSQKLTVEPSKHHHDHEHDGDGSNRMRPWKILLISLAVIVTVLVIVVITLLVWIKKKRGNSGGLYALTKEEVDEFKKGKGNSEAERNNGNIYDNLYIRALPFNSSYELPSDRLVIDRKIRLGKGQFGLIHPGTLIGDAEKDERALLQVAVKTVGPNMDNMYFKALLTELKVMAFLGSHQNVVSLLGAVTANIKRGEIYIALEYCAKGDVLNYLQQNRQHFHNVFAPLCEADDGFEDSEGYLAPNTATGTVTYTKYAPTVNDPGPGLNTKRRLSSSGVEYHSVTNPTISALDLVEWSRQIADAMSFISSKNVIHGDIAARNILLTDGYVAKIGDFGLSRQLLNYGMYFKTSTIPLPWKWLAVECLDAMNFSVQSDVWAFGVTLWEIFSLGQTPYAAGNYCHNSQLHDWLGAGNRMTSPSFANPELYELMLLCWKEAPAERITFDKLSFELQNLLSHLVKTTK